MKNKLQEDNSHHSSPLVSIIIPNFNYSQFVKSAVETALDQTYSNTEVIVVDDGSTDESLKVLQKFGNKIKLIRQEHGGPARARNRGIQEASGDYIAFLDADDLWKPRKIEKQLELFQTNSDLGLVYSGFQKVNRSMIPLEIQFPKYRGLIADKFSRGMDKIVLAGESTAMVSAKGLAEVGCFDPDLSLLSGWDLFRRISAKFPIDFVSAPLVLQRIHEKNHSKDSKLFEQDSLRKIEKMSSQSNTFSHYQKECFRRVYFSIARNYFESKNYKMSLNYFAKTIKTWPTSYRESLGRHFGSMRRK